MDSLLNEMKYDFTKGQRVKYFDHIGKIQFGKYLIAGTEEGKVVLDIGDGNTKVVAVKDIWSVEE